MIVFKKEKEEEKKDQNSITFLHFFSELEKLQWASPFVFKKRFIHSTLEELYTYTLND